MHLIDDRFARPEVRRLLPPLVAHRAAGAWIPACAGMTEAGRYGAIERDVRDRPAATDARCAARAGTGRRGRTGTATRARRAGRQVVDAGAPDGPRAAEPPLEARAGVEPRPGRDARAVVGQRPCGRPRAPRRPAARGRAGRRRASAAASFRVCAGTLVGRKPSSAGSLLPSRLRVEPHARRPRASMRRAQPRRSPRRRGGARAVDARAGRCRCRCVAAAARCRSRPTLHCATLVVALQAELGLAALQRGQRLPAALP